MAVLNEADRAKLWALFMRNASRERTLLSLTKGQLRAAINATDQWIENNASAFNTALPAAARINLTARQKAQLFFIVADKRLGVM